MKNTVRFFALAAVVAAFASCNEKVEAPVAKTDVVPMTISARSESRTVLRNDSQVHWISTDSLSVFDDAYNYYGFHNTSSSAAAETNFVYDSWPSDKTPEFAVYCYTNGETTRPFFDGDKATAILYANQTIYNKKSYAKKTGLSVGEIVYDGEKYGVEEMKNCYSLIQFKVKHSDILSIDVQGTNNEQLGGWVDIDYSKIQAIGEDDHTDPFWAGIEGKKSKIIKLNVTGSGGVDSGGNKVFDNASYYYIAVLPQVVQGLSFKVKKVDGTEETQVINGPIALNRSKIKKLAHPVDSALFQPANFIELDCTDATTFTWASEAAFPVRGAGSNPTEAFDFWLSGQTDYVFHGNVYVWQKHLAAASGSSIQLPNIEGYELSELTITSQYNSKQPTYAITDGTNTLVSFQVLVDDNKKPTNLPHTMTIPAEETSPERPNRYIVPVGEMNIKFTLKYIPVSE